MIPIFIASDEKFVKYMSVTIQSIIINTNEEIEFYILDGGITSNTKKKFYKMLDNTPHKIEFIKMNMKDFEQFPDIRHFSKNTYFRYLIPNLKPKLNKVLYIDADMIIVGDIKEIYDTSMENKGIAAVPYMDEVYNPDLYKKHKNMLSIPMEHLYFNAGLLLIDCDYWRNNNIINLLFKKTEELKDILDMPDQDVLNIIFSKEYKSLSAKYNLVVDVAMDYINLKEMISELSGCYILHYTGGRGVRPWINNDVTGAKYFWEYAKQTPFYFQLYQELIYNTLLQTVFSIKNNNIHKIITILGIKFKFKSKKLIKRKKRKEFNQKLNYIIDQFAQQTQIYQELNNKLNSLQDNKPATYSDTNITLNQLGKRLLMENRPWQINKTKFYLPLYPIDWIQRYIVDNNCYFEQDELKKLDNYIPKNAVILDIGANIGNHTLYWLTSSPNNIQKVYSFEPIKETFEILKKNIEINNLDTKAQIFNIGLSDKNTSADINVFNMSNIGGTSLEEGTGSLILKRLDDVAINQEHINFMKIDVEGMELKLLRGAEKTINKYRPIIFIESFPENFEATNKYLIDHDYIMIEQFDSSNYLYKYKGI